MPVRRATTVEEAMTDGRGRLATDVLTHELIPEHRGTVR
jgi:hypothetical protein